MYLRGYNVTGAPIGGRDYSQKCKGGAQGQPPFFGHADSVAPFIVVIMGLQHSLAMVGAVIPAPLLVADAFNANLGPEQTQYLISAALIMTGISSFIQVSQIRIPHTKIVIGTGVVSMIGTALTFLPASVDALHQMRERPEFLDGNGEFDGRKGYGAILGTLLAGSFVQVALAFISPKALGWVFPPIVTGVTVFLIGTSLVGTGFKYWGGGALCADNVNTDDPPLCTNNGDVELPFGSSQYIGLGFSVFSLLVLLEVFGSPFMKSNNVVIALVVGYVIAASSSHEGNRYIVNDKIDAGECEQETAGPRAWLTIVQACSPMTAWIVSVLAFAFAVVLAAENITFLWVHTYPLSVYPPLLLPTILAYLVVGVKTIGDVTTTEEVSRLPMEGPEHFERVRGGLLSIGLTSLLSALGTSLPNTTFSQSNGVIALTRCASRMAGIACCAWLILFGVLAKVAAFFTSIPDCVLGGMTTFLFANVAVSGVKIIASIKITRRDRFIVACSLGLGLGVTLVPAWVTNNMWNCSNCSVALQSIRDSVILVMSTGYGVGCATATLLNLIIPAQWDDEDPVDQAVAEGNGADVASGSTGTPVITTLSDDSMVQEMKEDV